MKNTPDGPSPVAESGAVSGPRTTWERDLAAFCEAQEPLGEKCFGTCFVCGARLGDCLPDCYRHWFTLHGYRLCGGGGGGEIERVVRVGVHWPGVVLPEAALREDPPC